MSAPAPLIAALLEPFQFDFMLQGMAMAVLVSVPMAMLSAYVVLKGWSLMGDAISHAVLPGVVLAALLGIPVFIGAFISGILAAVIIAYLTENSRVKEDTVTGVVFMGLFGSGLVLHSLFNVGFDIHDILFGNLLGIALNDIRVAAAIALTVSLALAAFGKDMLLHSFDALHARAVGLPSQALHYGFLILLTLVIVGSLKSVGLILAVGLLAAPGVIGRLLSNRFWVIQAIAVSAAVFSALAGTYIGFFIDSSPGATIVLVLITLFLTAYAWHRLNTIFKTALS